MARQRTTYVIHSFLYFILFYSIFPFLLFNHDSIVSSHINGAVHKYGVRHLRHPKYPLGHLRISHAIGHTAGRKVSVSITPATIAKFIRLHDALAHQVHSPRTRRDFSTGRSGICISQYLRPWPPPGSAAVPRTATLCEVTTPLAECCVAALRAVTETCCLNSD